ncbi:aspartate dehydrogenase [Butyrivibrio sp. XB500-5]|nr:aspartate dehydrogenase [Butyrivibrio sp. XB500-5]
MIRASICTGEQVAGFKDLVTGEFHEIMLIRDEKDVEDFKKAYGVEKVEKEY